jgi:hypothetical protein
MSQTVRSYRPELQWDQSCDSDVDQGGNMTGCSGCVTKETNCFANLSVGSQPVGIIPCGGFGHRTNVAVLIDQFSLRVRRTGGTRAVELLELLVGAHNDRQFFLDGWQLLAWDREVGVIVRGAGIDAVADAAEAGRRAG